MTARFCTCCNCGKVFQSEKTDDEALAEAREIFGDNIQKEDCLITCDDCYSIILGALVVSEEQVEAFMRGNAPTTRSVQ